MRNAGEVTSFKNAYVYKLTDIVKVSWKLNANQTFFVTKTKTAALLLIIAAEAMKASKNKNLLGEQAQLCGKKRWWSSQGNLLFHSLVDC